MFNQLQSTQPFDISIFEVQNNQINLTKICKHFGKDINEWKRLPGTQRFLDAYKKENQAMGLSQTLGKGKEQGTFGTREVALKVAQWISPEFEVFCIRKLDELFQTGRTEIKQLSRLEILELALETEKENLALKTKLAEAQPALEFTQRVQNSTNTLTIGEFAKVLGFGEIRLFDWLRNTGYLLKHPRNYPRQEYIENGYFKVIEKTKFVNGCDQSYTQTVITGKGQIAIQSKLFPKDLTKTIQISFNQ